MKKIVKLGLVSLISATLGLAVCCSPSKKNNLEIEYDISYGQQYNTDFVSVKVGEFETYDGDLKVSYYLDPDTNKWMKLERMYHNRVPENFYLREVSHDNVPGNPKGPNVYLIIDYDKGEEYAYGNFGGKRSFEFQEETLKNAKEWAKKMKEIFQSNTKNK